MVTNSSVAGGGGDSARQVGLEAECGKLACQEQTFGLDRVGNRESLNIHEKGSDS